MLNDNDRYNAKTTTQTSTKEEKKINVEMKRIMSEKKTTLCSLMNQDWKTVKSETEKINELLTNILTNNITDLNDFIYAGAKLVSEKNRCSPEDHWLKFKTQMGNQIRIADKKTMTPSKNAEKEEEYSNETEKERHREQKIQLDIPKKKKKLKKILRAKKRRVWAKTLQQPESKVAKRFWCKIWERKDPKKRAELINNMEKSC